MKHGLALEGGAMRGMFSCGVMDVLMENRIVFDAAAGISAGAVFGCNYKSKQPGRALRYNKKYGKDPRYCSLRNLFKTGDLYGTEFCYHILPNELDIFDRATFSLNPMEFYIGATNIETGRIEYYKCTNGGKKDLLWMRASASMPMVSRPVEISGKKYLDGGITDPIPYRVLDQLGYHKNVVILTQPKGYRKKKSKSLFLMKILLRKYPKAVQAMEKRHMIYNAQADEIERLEKEGKIYVIRPPKALGIKRTEGNPQKLEKVYKMGRAEAKKHVKQIKRFLKEKE
jgi:predicted patatin/cPLA2 family phospholipase